MGTGLCITHTETTILFRQKKSHVSKKKGPRCALTFEHFSSCWRCSLVTELSWPSVRFSSLNLCMPAVTYKSAHTLVCRAASCKSMQAQSWTITTISIPSQLLFTIAQDQFQPFGELPHPFHLLCFGAHFLAIEPVQPSPQVAMGYPPVYSCWHASLSEGATVRSMVFPQQRAGFCTRWSNKLSEGNILASPSTQIPNQEAGL
jgi:hypothetical protein